MMMKSLLLSALAVAFSYGNVAEEHFAKHLADSGMELTEAELEAFKSRFIKASRNVDDTFFDDIVESRDLFELERPAVYESFAKQLREKATWGVGMNPRFADMSERDFRKLQGLAVVDFVKSLLDGESVNPRSSGEMPPIPSIMSARTHKVAPGELPENFHVKDKWSECDSVTSIRDQSGCGSCWAVSAAAVVSDRMCIASKGTFNLPISAQFATACFTNVGNGCYGGDPSGALYMFSAAGAPTGGEFGTVGQTCYPYEVAPSDAQMMKADFGDEEEEAPMPVFQCKAEGKCPDLAYRGGMTTVEADMRKASSKVVYRLMDIDSIKYDLFHNGSVVAGFSVSEDIKYYVGEGVYTPVMPYGNGGHAVRIVGWGKEDGKDYWLISNSWGTRFGDEGYIKYEMGYSEMEAYVHGVEVGALDYKPAYVDQAFLA